MPLAPPVDATALADQLLAAVAPRAALAALQTRPDLALIEELKRRVDATKLRNAGQALRIAELALAAAQTAADPLADGLARWAYGNALYHLSRYQEALTAYRTAEAAYSPHTHALELLRLRINQVAVLQDLGAFVEALEVATAARAACIALGVTARPFLALLEMNSGAAFQQLARPDEALAAYARGRAMLVELDDQVQVARIDLNRANVLQELGRFAEAAALYAEARDLLQATDHPQEVARAEHNLGKLAYRRGHYQIALRHLEAARTAYAAIPNPLEMAKADLYRAFVYRDLNLLTETVELANLAGRAFRQAGARWERAMALIVSGTGWTRRGLYAPAERALSAARRLLRTQGALERLPPLDLERAELRLAQGYHASAQRLATRVANQLDAATWPTLAARAALIRARCALAANPPDHHAALRHGATAQRIATTHTLPERAAAAHVLAQAHEGRGEYQAASVAYATALEVAEGLRDRLPVDELRLGFLDDKLPIYRDAARLSLSHAAPEASLAALGALLRAPLAQPPAPAPPEIAHRLSELREAWHWHQSRLEDLSEGQQAQPALRSRLHAIEAELSDLALRQAVLTAPTLAQSHTNEVACMAARLKQRLAPDEGLLVAAPLGDQLAIMFVSTTGLVRYCAPVAPLERTLRSWRFQVAHIFASMAEPATTLGSAQAHLARMHAALIAPIAPQLAGLRRLLVALDPGWHDLPLAAAFDGERYLIEQLELASITAPAALLEPPPIGNAMVSGPALVIGHSDGGRLPHALVEAQAVADALRPYGPVTLLLEEQASMEQVRMALAHCQLLHIASHASFRSDNPRFSWVRLAGGRLSVAELADLTLAGSPLVVLSACETGRGLPRGGGLLGMGRTMQRAGATALIVSLWQVTDTSTAALMPTFYDLQGEAGTPATRLAAAQRRIIAADAHPFHWAGFVCVER